MSELSSRKTSSSSSPGLSGSSISGSATAGSKGLCAGPRPRVSARSMSGCSGVTVSMPTRPVASGARAWPSRLRRLSTSSGLGGMSCPAATSSSMSSRASWARCTWAKKRASAGRLPSSTAPYRSSKASHTSSICHRSARCAAWPRVVSSSSRVSSASRWPGCSCQRDSNDSASSRISMAWARKLAINCGSRLLRRACCGSSCKLARCASTAWPTCSISSTAPGMAASGVLSSCARPRWNSERAASSHSSSAICRGNWWPLYSRARRSKAVASSATGITPAMAALPLSVCRARCRPSLTGVSWPSVPCRKASRLARWPCASLRKMSSNCGSRPSMSAATGASFSARACRCPASCSISVSCGSWPAAKSASRSGR
ncbi:hypothetical protein D3C76_921820 [compost metagenome]